MKQRPIIFNTEMVQAIVDGRKTQTRRAITDKQLSLFKCAASIGECHYLDDEINPKSMGYYRQFCQFGEVGDQLYVRETFADCGSRLTYKADKDDGAHCVVKRWTPSIHMPRSYARILLEVTAVRVERLDDISEQDAKAEGFDYPAVPGMGWKLNAKHNFLFAWNKIYGNRSLNPFVWVIEFKVISTTGGAA